MLNAYLKNVAMDVFEVFRSALKKGQTHAARPGHRGVGAFESVRDKGAVRKDYKLTGGIVLCCPGMAMVLAPVSDDRDLDRY